MGNGSCSNCLNNKRESSNEVKQERSFCILSETKHQEKVPSKIYCKNKKNTQEEQLTNSFNIVENDEINKANDENIVQFIENEISINTSIFHEQNDLELKSNNEIPPKNEKTSILKRTDRNSNLECKIVNQLIPIPPLMINKIGWEGAYTTFDNKCTLSLKERTLLKDTNILSNISNQIKSERVNIMKRDKSCPTFTIKGMLLVSSFFNHNKPLLLSSDLSRIKNINDDNLNYLPCNSSETNHNNKANKNNKFHFRGNLNEFSIIGKIKEEEIVYGAKVFKDYNFESIVSYKEIDSLSDREIIYASSINKCMDINLKINRLNKPLKYINKFCTLTKSCFSYYSSYEKFVMLEKPIFNVSTKDLYQVDLINMKNKKEDIVYIVIFYNSNKQKNNNQKQYVIFNELLNHPQKFKKKNNLYTIYKWFIILNYMIYMNNSSNKSSMSNVHIYK